MRDSVGGARRPIAADRWAFGTCPTGAASLKRSPVDICLFDGFEPARIYELIYPAKNPWVMGLGYAVTRDLASFLRYATKDDAGQANPLARDQREVGIRRAYGTGTSSTGMYMRDYLYLGFNEDESHRKVFDAVRIAIPGTHRLFANVEFADPNVYSRQDQHHDFVSYSFPPLTYGVTIDPISGVRDGILKRPATDPLVIQIDTGQRVLADERVAQRARRPGQAGADARGRAVLPALEPVARRRQRRRQPADQRGTCEIPGDRQPDQPHRR